MEAQIQISNSYEKHEHGVGISIQHLMWCTKYRYKMFGKEEPRNLMAACVRRAASLHGIKMIELNVQPEHVHCIVGLPFTMSPSMALQILKGISARLFFQHGKKIRLRYPKGHLWSRGKFSASLGFVQMDVVQNYVKNQGIQNLGNRTL
jgi:putative transposase